MKIEVLFVPGCPNAAPTVARLREILGAESAHAHVQEVEVRDAATAAALAFPGSPTVRINGRDIAGDALPGAGPMMACRLYATGPSGGIPSLELMRSAVREAHRSHEP